MSDVAICTDSSALFPEGAADRFGVTVVPIAVALDGEPLEAPEEDVDRFYERLADGAKAQTSQPSPGELLSAYARAAENGAAEVLSIHLDARLSGTVGSAELAARQSPIPVAVADTRTASFGVGVCVRAAADLLAAGASAEEAAVAVRRLGPKLRNAFVAPSGSSGRIGEITGWTVLELADGSARPLSSCASVGEASAAMVRPVDEVGGPVQAAVGHAAAVTAAAADALAHMLEASAEVVHVERYRIGPAVGAHTGPLSFGLFWWSAAL